MIKEKGERVHVLVPGGAPGHLWVEPALLQPLQWLNPRRGSLPLPASSATANVSGEGFGGAQIALMYPGRRFLVLELPTPGGLCSSAAIDHPVGPQLFLHNHPPLPGTPQTRQIWQQNWTGRSKPCPNFGRLDQSMQITAPTAIA